MATSDDFIFERTTTAGLHSLSEFIREQTGNKNATAEYLQWWFLKNPVSCSLHHAILNGKMAGVAATNNFRMLFNGGQKIVAMPQKVLTDSALRGRGLFSKLYFKTEEENLQTNHAGFFLTFTNDASTPLFIRKFGYTRGISPDVLLIFPGVNSLLASKKYFVGSNLAQQQNIQLANIVIDNSIVKDENHYRWRYFSYNDKIVMLTATHDSSIQVIFLKRVVKGKIPFYAVLDVVADSESGVSQMLRHALHYSLHKFSAGLMVLNHQQVEGVIKNFLYIRVKNRFHFLVKGKSEDETATLATTKFNFTFGDLDFI
jgi:hypothetical protein